MLKVVFDTNVYISAFITRGGRAETAYLGALGGDFILYSSVPILMEMARILRVKFSWEDTIIRNAIRHVAAASTIVRPPIRLSLLGDEPDNRILECSRSAQADLIVTGDRHLLDLRIFEQAQIVSLSRFVSEYLS